MKILSLVIMIGLFSCAQDHAIRLSDLKFPDPGRVFIKQNRVDTTFIFISGEDGRISRYFKTYDENGSVLVDSTDTGTVRYQYDNRGLLIKREVRDGYQSGIDSLLYEFDEDSMILKQRWINTNIEFRFIFDEKWRVKQSVKTNLINGRIEETINYTYDGDLLKNCVIVYGKNGKFYLDFDYYYSSKNVLDSATLKTDNGHRQRWVYDSLGLLNAEWSGDYKSKDRFVHKTRK